MDSKSIPRKGVGVRLPSLAPSTTGATRADLARELGAWFVPLLGRRIRAATLELRAFERELARAPRRTLASEARAQHQDELTEELRRAGYCLGVLGAGARADLLRGRHEPDGLRWMLGELWAALDTSSTPPASALPDLELRAERAVGFLLAASWAGLMAARKARAPLRWAVTNGTLAFGRTRMTAELRRRAREVSAACAADLRVTPEALELALS